MTPIYPTAHEIANTQNIRTTAELIHHHHTMHFSMMESRHPGEDEGCRRLLGWYCFVAYDPTLTMYWQSNKYSQHSCSIARQRFGRLLGPSVLLSAANSNNPPNSGNGVGIEIYANAHELRDKEDVQEAMDYLSARAGQEQTKGPADFLGNSPNRLYAARPYRVSVHVAPATYSVPLNLLREAILEFSPVNDATLRSH